MDKSDAQSLAAHVAIALNAVLTAIEGERTKVLCVQFNAGEIGLPYGPFDPQRHRTFEIGVREWVERQTKVSLGFIEQLYTFGDKGREAPIAALAGGGDDRIVSVGYLALASSPAEVLAEGASWRSWYSFFPWEDWRGGEPAILKEQIIPALAAWIDQAKDKTERTTRRTRINLAFGINGFSWAEERTLDRYELMYEAGIVTEAKRDRKTNLGQVENGTPMISDHRRILATAIGRLRGKLKYRPIIFEMMQWEFTLLQLQRNVEAIVGFEFHKQNFRRSIEKSCFVRPTGKTIQQASGRPAALFRVNRDTMNDSAAMGLTIPRLRRDGE